MRGCLLDDTQAEEFIIIDDATVLLNSQRPLHRVTGLEAIEDGLILEGETAWSLHP